MKKLIITIIALFTLLTSCEEYVFDMEYQNTPVENFEALWSEYDQLYGLFKVRNIDWDQVYEEHRSRISNQSSSEDLYNVLVDMLTILDDSHVGLYPTNDEFPLFFSGLNGRLETSETFHLDVVKNNYLKDAKEEFPFTWGFLDEQNAVGYLYIAGEPGDKLVDKLMPDIIQDLQNVEHLIVDIRNNTGGEDRGSQAITSYFTDQRRPFMQVSIKNGPDRDDFTTPETWYIEPKGITYDGPIMLLTNRHTVSAGETLTMAMNTLPQVTSVGDTTMGAFSNAAFGELPNGQR
ncbi:MAG: S41 family peptidase [Bacteroidota bacterium]